jgi:phage-related minor tail protein
MPFQKGQSGNPNGKKPGPNKKTTEFRATVQALLESNAENVAIWLQRVADGVDEVKPDPGRALDLLAKLAEYASPKLARTEHTGEGGGPVIVRASAHDEAL